MKHIFIVNPYAGSMTFANNLRQQLESMDGLEYFLFNSRYTGNETELVEKILHFFPEEKLRIYACGGSGTFRNVLEGVGENPNVELAFYPCGMTNDFLKCFSSADRRRFLDIKELITGDVLLLDSILTNHGRAMNTFSCGIDANMLGSIANQHPVRRVGIQIPYSFYAFRSLVALKKTNMRVRVEGQNLDGYYDEIVWANGRCLGGSLCMTKDYRPDDGLANYILVPSRGRVAFVAILLMLLTQNTDYVNRRARTGTSKKFFISRADKGTITANLDGETIQAAGEWEMEIRPDSVRFVVPRGVHLS